MKIKDPESLAKWVGKLSFENHPWFCLSTSLFEPSFKTASQVQPYLMSHGQVQPCFTSQWSQYGPNGLKGAKLGLPWSSTTVFYLSALNGSQVHDTCSFPLLSTTWHQTSLGRWTKVLGLISFDSLYFDVITNVDQGAWIDIFIFLVFLYHGNPVHYIMISWPRWTKMLGPWIMDIF